MKKEDGYLKQITQCRITKQRIARIVGLSNRKNSLTAKIILSKLHAKKTPISSARFYQGFRSLLSDGLSSSNPVCKVLLLHSVKIRQLLVKFFPLPLS